MKYSIVNYKETFTAYNDYRLDADYYHSDFIHLINSISKKYIITLNDNSFYITDGEHGSPCWDVNTNIKYITAENIKPNYIEENDFKTISIEQDERNKRSRLRQNDILIYSVGVFAGYAALAEPHLFPANIPRSVAIIRLKKYDKLIPEYVCVFINSKYGQFQTKRLQAGNAQPMLALEKISKLRIVCLNIEFQKIIKRIYNKSYELRRYTTDLYLQSLFILNKELNIENWIPKHKLWSVKNYSDVKDANRLDAEYFQPKYDEIMNILNKNGYTRLIDNFNIVRNSGLEYHEDGKIGVIKTKQIKDKFIDFNVESKTNLYEDNVIVKNKDVLFASMGVGSLGKTNIYYNFENNNEFIIDSTLKIFRKKINGSISPELLEAYLHTQIAQELIYQNVVGSSGIISVYESYLQELPIPIINNSVEQKIVENIKTAHLLYYQSKQLLEIAKRGVEIAIEQDENIATNWINQELQKIGVEL